MEFEYDAESSPSDIIMTFNDFIATIPFNKSFDMSYKAYIQDFADLEERRNLSRLSSCTLLRGTSSTCLSSYGQIKHFPSNTSMLDRTHLSLKTGPISTQSEPISTYSESTATYRPIRPGVPARLATRPSPRPSSISPHNSSPHSVSPLDSDSTESVGKVTLRQMDEIYRDNLTRKRRSMVNLTELNKTLGLPHIDPPPSLKTPDTIYENLSSFGSFASPMPSTFSSFASPAPSTFSCTHDEFARVIPSAPRGQNVDLMIKISECFD